MQIFHIRRWVIRMLYSVVDLGRQAVMECWRHTVSVEMPERSVRPAVLVIPGGGYSYISDRECEPVASAFFAKGFHVFVLRYAVGKDADKGRPFMNAMAAIVMLRRKAEDWGIAASKIAVCGFSAGGHLAAASGILSHTKEWLYEVGCTEGENLPNAVILGYPVITSGQYGHQQSFENLGSTKPDDEIAQNYSLERHITANTPPVFVWHTVEDKSVPVENTLLLIEALRRNRVPFEAHLFEKGAHGGSICSAEVGREDSECSPWFDMAVRWLSCLFSFKV